MQISRDFSGTDKYLFIHSFIKGIGPRLSFDIESFKKLHNIDEERSNLPFVAISSESEITLFDLKSKLDFSSKKLCNFLKYSISKQRRGPMPFLN